MLAPNPYSHGGSITGTRAHKDQMRRAMGRRRHRRSEVRPRRTFDEEKRGGILMRGGSSSLPPGGVAAAAVGKLEPLGGGAVSPLASLAPENLALVGRLLNQLDAQNTGTCDIDDVAAHLLSVTSGGSPPSFAAICNSVAARRAEYMEERPREVGAFVQQLREAFEPPLEFVRGRRIRHGDVVKILSAMDQAKA